MNLPSATQGVYDSVQSSNVSDLQTKLLISMPHFFVHPSLPRGHHRACCLVMLAGLNCDLPRVPGSV